MTGWVSITWGRRVRGTEKQPSCLWLQDEELGSYLTSLLKKGLPQATAPVDSRGTWLLLQDRLCPRLPRVLGCSSYRSSV